VNFSFVLAGGKIYSLKIGP